MSTTDAFLLLMLENATLSTSAFSQSGTLGLECVTVQIPEAPTPADRNVYLVLRLGSLETAIDPARVIYRTDGYGWRKYTFRGTEIDPTEMLVTLAFPADGKCNPLSMEDLETFESILAQYADLRGSPDSASQASAVDSSNVVHSGSSGSQGDLRGHLVVINEVTGEVLGQFDDSRFSIKEDPKLHQRGREADPVIIEIPCTNEGDEGRTPMEMFVRTVPADQRDWITKSATLVSHAISQTTNLLLTTITTASNYYVSHSTPSSSNTSRSGTPGTSTDTPPPLPSRALVFLTSENTRRGLASVHAVSGQAVKVSSATVSMIDSMIRHAMGAKPKRPRAFLPAAHISHSSSPQILSTATFSGTPPQLPTRTPPSSSPGAYLAPPHSHSLAPTPSFSFPNDKPPLPPRLSPSATPPIPRGAFGAYPDSEASSGFDDKPRLPPRRSPSPAPPPVPPRTGSGAPPGLTPLPPYRLTTKDRVLLSADLIISTLDHSTRQLLHGGTESVRTVVGHKYGPDAGHSSALMAETARNVGLVYVDMAGIGRRALLKRAGVQFVKGRLSNNRSQ